MITKIAKGSTGPVLQRGTINMIQSQKYAIHLDNLRQKHNITVEELCSDIVDPRTYRRYKTGEKTLTHRKVILFCFWHLVYYQTNFYFSARQHDNYEFQLVNTLYSYLSSKKYDEYWKESQKVNSIDFDDIQNKRFLDFCFCKYGYETGKEKLNIITNKLHELANYPECLKYDAFDFVTFVSLQLIAEIEVKHNKKDALLKLIELLTNTDLLYTSAEVSSILPSIFSNVALYLLRLKMFYESNRICDSGIAYSLRHSDLSGLAHLYYSKSYSSLELGKRPQAEENAILCILTAIIKKDQYEIEMFKKALSKDLNVDPLVLITKYKNLYEIS